MGRDVPIKKGAQALLSLIMSGYRYQRSGTKSFARVWISSSVGGRCESLKEGDESELKVR